jgi:hypothetical protein
MNSHITEDNNDHDNTANRDDLLGLDNN